MSSRSAAGGPMIRLIDEQKKVAVDARALTRLARVAVKALKIEERGRIDITLITDGAMRRLNKRALRHDYVTDVITFRYPPVEIPSVDGVIGDIVIAPARARAYARKTGADAREELGRYVVHGLLHWVGHDDRTAEEQVLMRRLEDQLLDAGGFRRSVERSARAVV